MATDVDMSSNALLLIGDAPISSFNEAGAGATAAANLYPATYERVLAEHPWSFATKFQELSKLSQTPDSRTNFQYVYQLPSDMIALWAIKPNNNYQIVNGLLYSNQGSGLLAQYIYKVDEQSLPAHFVKAMEYKLAAEFAISVTDDAQKAQLYEGKYFEQIALARGIDSRQSPPVPIIDSPFTDVRNGGRF